MAFVNEYISEEDLKKYDVEGMFKKLGVWKKFFESPRPPGCELEWTIDRERDVFITWIDVGREEFCNRLTFALWWKGQVLSVGLEVGGDGSLVGRVTTVWRLLGIAYPNGKAFDGDRDTVILDLKDALTEYKVHGIKPVIADHTAVFEF